ncbi:sigma-54 interaction domain-containing protein [Planctomycetota bacterium]
MNTQELLQVGDTMPTILEEKLVGESIIFTNIKTAAVNVAKRHSTVLILGETGTGKEMLAKYIHQHSDRADKPFVPVDCAALAESLFESEMFGHAKGSFTGAVTDSLGFIQAADGGTLFLDEIGELSLTLQTKLLRVLQERQVVPVGNVTPKKIDVRVICATNRNLENMIQDRTFREDLFFRFSVVTMTIPPLRKRAEDILLLADYFLKLQADLYGEQKKRLSSQAMMILCRYNWPGNIRQLANVMEHAHIVTLGQEITPDDLSLPFKKMDFCSADNSTALTLDEIQRQAIVKVLKQTNHCKAQTSRLLDVNIQRLNRMIKRFDIQTV